MAISFHQNPSPRARPQPGGTSDKYSETIDEIVPYDGGILHYRLEGCADAGSPVLLFSNAFLTNLHIWDSTVSLLKARHPEYRFLPYDTRGYLPSSLGTTHSITLDVLTTDISNLLSRLSIPHVHTLIGSKFGGVLALAFASRYPSCLENLIVCGCEISTTPKSEKTCDETLRYVRTWGMNGVLKDKCVALWFTADAREGKEWKCVRDMVAGMDYEGLEGTIGAQYAFDERGNLGKIRCPTLFVSGSEDGILPETMSMYPEMMGGAAEYRGIGRASGLPMMERPDAFVEVISDFLRLGDDP